MTEFEFGLEIECSVMNITFPIGGYHCGTRISRNWQTEHDGSLNASRSNMQCVEFVSRKFKMHELEDMIYSLKFLVDPLTPDKFVGFNINESCGAHIHFSPVGNKGRLDGVIPLGYMVRAREMIHKRVKENFSASIYDKFSKHYRRSYAKTTDPLMAYPSNFRQRNIEFNGTHKTGMEWRSFNLLGVRKWSDMIKMYTHAFETITEVFGPLFDAPKPDLKKIEEKLPKRVWSKTVQNVERCDKIVVPKKLESEQKVIVNVMDTIQRNGVLCPYESVE